jgi:eukaryotic-like serine/threonine-protein kinase
MAAPPATIDAFLDLVRKSGMVEDDVLALYMTGLSTQGVRPDKAHRLARRMIEDGLLTTFQAEQFLKGRYRGFAIGNYRILERIAHGGMGTVYLAEHVHMSRRMAVKVLPHELAKNQPVLERFYREARAAAALQHPNLIRATDVDCEEGVHYLVMEYIEGVNLQNLVDRRGPLSVERAANYIGQAACGLQFAHQVAGMVHRDIKPANLMLDRTGTVKILDMGLARMRGAGFFNAQIDDITRKHNDQNVLGTADYIAPEQALDSQAADIRADIYSLGGAFYFCLTGVPPFPDGCLTQKLMAHQLREPKPVRSLRPQVPQELATLIMRMMAKSPEKRPQTPGEVVEVLAPWLALPLSPPTDDEIPPLCAAVPPSGMAGLLSPSWPGLPGALPPAGQSNRVASPGADTAPGASRADTEQPTSGRVSPGQPPVAVLVAGPAGAGVPAIPLARPLSAPQRMTAALTQWWEHVPGRWVAVAAAVIVLLGGLAWWWH